MEDRWYFLLSIIFIVAFLSVIFMSQQPRFRQYGRDLQQQATESIDLYWSNSTDWFKTVIYPKIALEVEKRGEPLKEEVITQKDNAVKSIWEKIKNYFAEKFSNFSGTKVE